MPQHFPRCQIVPLAAHQVSIQIDGEEKLRWNAGRDYPRPFFFPFNGPSGHSLTRMGHPGAPNHDHHQSVWFAHNKVLGIEPIEEEAPAEILALAEERQTARKAKDFARSDQIRDELATQGWVIEDTPRGPRVKRGP